MQLGVLYGDISQELSKFEVETVQASVVASNAQVGIADLETPRARLLYDRAVVEPSPTFNVMGAISIRYRPAFRARGLPK